MTDQHETTAEAERIELPARDWLPIWKAKPDGTRYLLAYFEDDPGTVSENDWICSGWYETGPADQRWYCDFHQPVAPTHFRELNSATRHAPPFPRPTLNATASDPFEAALEALLDAVDARTRAGAEANRTEDYPVQAACDRLRALTRPAPPSEAREIGGGAPSSPDTTVGSEGR